MLIFVDSPPPPPFFCLSLTSFVITHAQNTVPPNRLFWTAILSIWWATEQGRHTHKSKGNVMVESSCSTFFSFCSPLTNEKWNTNERTRHYYKRLFIAITSTENKRKEKEIHRLVPRTPCHIVRSETFPAKRFPLFFIFFISCSFLLFSLGYDE